MLAATWFEPAIVAPELERFRIRFLLRGTLGVSAVAGVASWALFRRLEAADGGGPIVALPRWGRDRVATRAGAGARLDPARRPMWQLAKKELHLQQMTIFVGAVYIVWWVAMLLISRIAPAAVGESAEAIAIGYGPLLGLLAGSLASAEERQLGTLGWQVLLPVAMWKQWAVKAGVVFGLALAIGAWLPALLLSITPNISGIQVRRGSSCRSSWPLPSGCTCRLWPPVACGRCCYRYPSVPGFCCSPLPWSAPS